MAITLNTMAKELDRLRPEMLERMLRMGYKNVSEFGRDLERQDIVSSETARRALGGSGGYPKVQVENLIKILSALNYSPVEIGAVIKNMGCNFWPRLLQSELSHSDSAWLALIHKLGSVSEDAYRQLIGAFRMFAKGEGIDIEDELNIIERKVKLNG